MESEILNTLLEIRGMLLVIIAGFVLWFVMVIWMSLAKALPLIKKKPIDEQAQELFDKGEYEQIVTLCENKLGKTPNHMSTVWWLAKANYNLGKYTESKQLFERVLETEPNWKLEYVQPYLEKIDEILESH